MIVIGPRDGFSGFKAWLDQTPTSNFSAKGDGRAGGVRSQGWLLDECEECCPLAPAEVGDLTEQSSGRRCIAIHGAANSLMSGRGCKLYYAGTMADRMVNCVKLGQELPGLDEVPFDSELGQKIYDNVSKIAWAQWAEHLKMIINEYRLNPATLQAQEMIVKQMEAYFFGEGAAPPPEYVAPGS